MNIKQIVTEIQCKMKEIETLEEHGIDNYLSLPDCHQGDDILVLEELMKKAIVPVMDKIEDKKAEILKLLDSVEKSEQAEEASDMQEFIVYCGLGTSVPDMVKRLSGIKISNTVVHGDNGVFHVTCRRVDLESIATEGWSFEPQTHEEKTRPLDKMVMTAILP